MTTTRARLAHLPKWKLFAAAYAALSTGHLGALLVGNNRASDMTQIFLMLVLAATVVAATKKPRSRLVRLLLLSLFFSWLGDTLPRFMDGDQGFLTMVSMFLIAQFVFIGALWPHRADSILKNPALILPYAAFLVTLIALCAPQAGSLLVPILIYGTALCTMAVLSTGLGRLSALGGAIFFVSDALIALRSFSGISLPAHGFLVMSTYITAQALLAIAFVRHSRVTEQLAAPVSA